MTIETQEGGLYKVSGQVIQALAHKMINPCELWHRKFGHLNYNALPGLQKMVTCMSVFSFEHDRVCRGELGDDGTYDIKRFGVVSF
jgi:hypothetical protein